jgi:hypothetical protein
LTIGVSRVPHSVCDSERSQIGIALLRPRLLCGRPAQTGVSG